MINVHTINCELNAINNNHFFVVLGSEPDSALANIIIVNRIDNGVFVFRLKSPAAFFFLIVTVNNGFRAFYGCE